MVYTLTLNPSLDYIIGIPNYKPGEVNRADYDNLYPGGKGINVSIMLERLGVKTKALGFTAGVTGDILEKMLSENNVPHEFVRLDSGLTRINVKLKAKDETEINGAGPAVTPQALEALSLKLDDITENDILVLSGAVPKAVPDDIYGKITRQLNIKGIKCVVDTSGEALKKALIYKPFLVKPNISELSELFGLKNPDKETIIKSAAALRKMGAKNVLVSLAENGALLIDETGKIHEKPAPAGKTINSTGAGDSMIAGFIFGFLDTYDYGKALATGVAAGSASAFSDWLAEKQDVLKLID